MKNKEIVSAVLGSTFFGIPYLALGVTLFPSLAIGASAFIASELMLNGNTKEILKEKNRPLYLKLNTAKKENKEILNLIPKVDSLDTRKDLNDIHSTVSEIINVVENNPKKADKLDNFFDYYLPVLIKIVKRYDEIENKKLSSSESKTFMKKADNMISDTKDAFNTILSTLYKKDLIDIDADMKVYDLMLKADGITGDKPIMKGSDSDE